MVWRSAILYGEGHYCEKGTIVRRSALFCRGSNYDLEERNIVQRSAILYEGGHYCEKEHTLMLRSA
jgi:hypothetical protein